jgi:hypothetical protein
MTDHVEQKFGYWVQLAPLPNSVVAAMEPPPRLIAVVASCEVGPAGELVFRGLKNNGGFTGPIEIFAPGAWRRCWWGPAPRAKS